MLTSLKYWRYCKSALVLLILSFLCSLLSITLSVILIDLINVTISSGTDGLKQNGTMLLFVLISSSVFELSAYVMKRIGRIWAYLELNNKFTNHILHLDYDSFTKYSCSYIVTVSEQMNGIISVTSTLFNALSQFGRVVITLYAMYKIIPDSIFPYIVLYIVGAISIYKLFYLYGKYQKKSADIRRDRNQEIDEIINGFSEVRLFNTQMFHRHSIAEKNERDKRAIQELTFVDLLIESSIHIVDNTGIVFAIIFAIRQITTGAITVSSGISLVLYSQFLVNGLIVMLNYMDDTAENYHRFLNLRRL